MRICFVSRRFFPTISGMSVYALNLLQEMVRRGHDLTMVSQYYGGETAGVYGDGPPTDVEGVRIIGLESVGEQADGDFERDIAEMVDVIAAEHERQPFDLIHAQYAYPTGLAALKASRRLSVPNAVSIQGGDGHWVGSCCATHEAAMHAVLGHAGALLIGARSFANEVTERLGTPPERFTIVPGAVDVERFCPPDGHTPGALSEPPVLLYHGRVDERKGVLDLLDAFAMLTDETDVHLRISGIGPDVDAAAERIEALGLGDRADMTGRAVYDEAPQVYREADLFVSPTYAEGFSNTILEAMATGLPICSTRTVGVVDCLRNDGNDDDNALLVEPGDPPALADALRRLLNEDALRKRLARTALDEARATYSWQAVGAQIEGVYEDLRGTTPDTDWSLPDGPPADCRFREEPHLL